MSREYPDRPMVGIGVVVFRADKVLLIRRGKPPRLGQWSLPGGLQELGETVFQAAVREVREECAVAIEPLSIIDIVDAITPDADGRVRFHYTLVEVLAEWRAGEPVAGDDAMDAAWIDPASIEGLGMWEQATRIIAKGRTMRG
ncbi:MAG: NUDIX hydrolase [Alphaproteobacteria bacterium]|nr:NUDIX hydrolase [Alphaproteobacteria bacterium]